MHQGAIGRSRDEIDLLAPQPLRGLWSQRGHHLIGSIFELS